MNELNESDSTIKQNEAKTSEEPTIFENIPSIPPNSFIALNQLDANIKYLELAGTMQTVQAIRNGLIAGGFKVRGKHFHENLRSMLRYYHTKKGIFSRNNEWRGLSVWKEETVKSAAVGIKPESGKLSFEAGTKDAPVLKLVRSTHASEPVTYVDYFKEIFAESGLPWLHVEQIVAIFKERYNLDKDKQVVAAILRKNAQKGKHFKAFGKNCLGLLDQKSKIQISA